MERYHIYKLGIAILFYAVYCRRPMLVNGLETDDVVGTVNNKSSHDHKAGVYYQGVQGVPGVDFPVFTRIPRTSFSCKTVESGYYADLETNCQVFHICNEGTKVSFLCPNGTIFQQSDLICDWWFKVNCTNSPNLYEESAEQLRDAYIRRKASRRVTTKVISDRMDSSEESQVPQETASFFKNNHYANHRDTYSEIKDPRNYYDKKIAGSKALNNGRPFVVSTPTFGVYSTTERSNFKYSPTVPTMTPKPAERHDVTTHATTFGTRLTTIKNYNNIESFTSPPSIRNGEPVTPRKLKYKSSSNVVNNSSHKQKNNIRLTVSSGQNFRTVGSVSAKPSKKEPKQGNVRINLTSNGGSKSFKSNSPNSPRNNNFRTTLKSEVTNKNDFEFINKNNTTSTTIANSEYHKDFNSHNTVRFQTKLSENTNLNIKPAIQSNDKQEQFQVNSNLEIPDTVEKSLITAAPFETTTQKYTTASETYATTPNTIEPTFHPSSRIPKAPILHFAQTTFDDHNNAYDFEARQTTEATTTQLYEQTTPSYTKTSSNFRIDLSDGLRFDDEFKTNEPTFRSINGFYVTKQNTISTSSYNAGSATGSDNTYIPTIKPSTTPLKEYHSNTFGFLKPTGIPKPKPFELPPESAPKFERQYDFTNPTQLPNYQISSASPFTNKPPILPNSYTTPSSVISTLPTIYTSAKAFSAPVPLSHVSNMIDTLKSIANATYDYETETSRPGLVVPPSVGPQTLHTLAVYFANALDGLVPDNFTSEVQTEQSVEQNEDLVINSLLSQHTVNKYNELFKGTTEKIKDDEDNDGNDLDREHSSNAVQSPRVRQLAKVFTQALSSYLDDPDMFRKVLEQIRPTEPPPLNSLTSEVTEEDELLNFSDADIKPENPRLPTPAPANPTWGYILALNNSDFRGNHIDNNLENLQGADSQSFVPSFNEINVDRNKNLSREATTDKLPNNHWTSSPEVSKLWETTLYINPIAINQKLETTEAKRYDTTAPTSSESFDVTSAEHVIDYELHALPQLELNSTQIHGLLIDFMNTTRTEEGGKLQRILNKLNTTEEEFLKKMREIESNPLTRRLILLLISECDNEKNKELRTTAVRDIIKFDKSTETRKANSFSLVDEKLKDDDQDSRALQLLNSLYSIASKYGK